MYGFELYKLSSSSGQTFDHSLDQSIPTKRLRENFGIASSWRKQFQFHRPPPHPPRLRTWVTSAKALGKWRATMISGNIASMLYVSDLDSCADEKQARFRLSDLFAEPWQGCAARPRRVVHFDGLERSASDVDLHT